MQESPTSQNDEKQPDGSVTLPRRRILQGTVVAGAFVVGMGSASASGQGGQAVVHETDYRPDASFVITEVADCKEGYSNPDGSCWDDPLYFQCDGKGGRVPPGKGGTIPFPYWHFNYLDEVDENGEPTREPRKLYTRDNEVKTGVTYRWPGQEKQCGEYIQTGFAAGNGRK